jgi:hypothetical protein
MGTLNEDLTGIKAIEDKLTANKVANFAYTDHAYENPLTEADGVEYYNVDNEQNIPVPDPSVMDVNETVLTKGFRSQASSIPRMLMNHFLGRTSYNLNKLNDNMSSLLATLMSHLGSANGIAPLNANGVLDIAKGGTNASTVNEARTNLNINNVVNTGDSATPTENGTAKFTTGGAYTELNKKVDKSSVTSSVTKGNNNPVTSSGVYNYRYSPKGYNGLDAEGWYKIAEFGKRNRGQSIVIDLCRGYSINPNESHHIIISYGWTDVNVFDFAKSTDRLFNEIKLCWNSNNNDKLAIYVHYNSSNNNSCYFSISGMVVDSQYAYTTNLEIFNFSTDSLTWENSKTISLGENGFYINGENRTPEAPTTDGNYFLKSAVSGGTPSYSWQGLSDTVEDSNMNPVTSNAVSKALAVPSDATLHYSFDDVPDYPDGTVVYYRNKNFASVEDWSVNTNEETLSVEDSCLKIQSLGNRTAMLFINNTVLSASNINGKIIKINFTCNDLSSVYLQDNGGSYVSNNIFTVRNIGGNRYEAIGLCGTYTYNQTLNFRASTASANNYVVLEAIYIGDGSYSTPIIDNSGDNMNAVNNGGIAVQGVCGKGVYFPSSSQTIAIPTSKIPAPTSNDDFTISCWLNVSAGYQSDNQTSCYKPIISVGAYEGGFGLVRNLNNIVAFARDSANARTVSVAMDKGKPHLYTAVYNGTAQTFTLYVDGVSVGTTSASVADYKFGSGLDHWNIWSNTVMGGGGSTTTQQPAMLDDVMFFNRALSEDEVTALYLNKANTPKFYNINNYLLDNRSAVPAENGTDLFTTGGAYTELAKKAPVNHASTTTDYGVASYDTYGHVKTGANLSVKNITEDTVYAPQIHVGVSFGVPDDILINKTGNSHTVTVQGKYYFSPFGPSSGSQSYLVAILSSNPSSIIHSLEITSSQTSDQFSFTLPAHTMAFVFTTDIGYTVRGITT